MTTSAEIVPPPTSSGFVPFREGEFQTFYKIWGTDPRELKDNDLPPIIILHGGPGFPHYYMLTHADLTKSRDGKRRSVILYDQVGCGQSTSLKSKAEDEGFWRVRFYVEELENLLSYFKLGGPNGKPYDLLGHSWGGIVGSEFAVSQPKGLRKLVLASSPNDMKLWGDEVEALRGQLPTNVREILEKHERDGTTESKEYEETSHIFNSQFICRMKDWPEVLLESFEQLKIDPTVYFKMNGPSEMHIVGVIKDWSVISRLDLINVPTLVTSGKWDEATPRVNKAWTDGIGKTGNGGSVRHFVFDESAHLPHLEEREKYIRELDSFLL